MIITQKINKIINYIDISKIIIIIIFINKIYETSHIILIFKKK